MQKEIHIWLVTPKNKECLTDYLNTGEALYRGDDIIHTTQLHFCSFSHKRRIFVHVSEDEVHEITLGDCEGTERELREGHNIEKLLIAGEFSWF